MILDALTWPVLIMMIICIGIAPIFSGEYQSKCDSLILCMKYGKSRLVSAKIIVVWLFTTCVYWGITLIYSAVYLGLLGTDGADLPIQLKYLRYQLDTTYQWQRERFMLDFSIFLYLGNCRNNAFDVCSTKKRIWCYYHCLSFNYNTDLFITGYRWIYLEPNVVIITI